MQDIVRGTDDDDDVGGWSQADDADDDGDARPAALDDDLAAQGERTELAHGCASPREPADAT